MSVKKLVASGLVFLGCLLSVSNAGAKEVTILINGVPVKELYVDSEGRLYLTPGAGRKPVKIEIPALKGEPLASESKRIKIGGKAYIHWDYNMSGDQEKNAFKITRNYLEVRGYFSDKNYFRTTLDVKQDANVDRGSYVVRLKYAYVYFHDVLPHTGVEIGMVHKPWIDWEEHHGWLHRDVEKTFMESKGGANLMPSADLGVDFKGRYGIASWEVGIFNGEGYHDVEGSSHFGKSVEGRLSLNLLEGFTLSFHTVHSFDQGGEKYDRHIYQVHAVYDTPYFLLAGQYLWNSIDSYGGEDRDQEGYSVNGDLKLRPILGYPVGLLARYDHWDLDDKVSSDERDQFIYGVFYRLNRHVKFSLAHERIIDDGTEVGDKSTLMAVTKIKW